VYAEVDMKKVLFILFFVMLVCPAWAQEEIFVNGGATRDTKTGNTALQWSVTYRQALAEHAAFSFSYINEGHQPNHYRDGFATQIWGRTSIPDPKLSFALGVGPYAYFDTKLTPVREVYENAHGWGVISSATADWSGLSPFLLQVRLNYINTQHSFDTLSATFGIGYLLGAERLAAGSASRPPQGTEAHKNEITSFLGQTVLNSARGEKDTAMGIEYRRSLFRYMDWTAGFLNEGDARPIGRYGVMSQLWAVHPFFNDNLALGIGGGPYLARDKYSGEDGQRTTLAGALSLTASYRLTSHLAVRGAFHRIITDYSRDTDVFLGGLSYRF
jgi:hypothetical protein